MRCGWEICKLFVHCEAEAAVLIGIGWGFWVTGAGGAPCCCRIKTAAAVDTLLTGSGACRIGLQVFGLWTIPVLNGFHYIACHIIEAEFVWILCLDWVGSVVAIISEP